MLDFACPGCGRKLKVKGELAGRKVKCPHCACALTAPATSAAAVSSGAAPGATEAPTVLPRDVPAEAPRDTSSEADPTNGPKRGPADELTAFLAPPQDPSEIGRLGPYRILKVLGAGGMGVVFQAEDPHLQRLVALKAMLPALAASASARQRFMREARAAAAVEHDHIVAIYQVGEDRGVPFLAMPLLKGEPLDQRLKREKRLSLAEVLRIGRETAAGLEAARQRGMIHRDIKPANLWLEEGTGRVKILDFGLARAADDDMHLTQQGAILGTPAYMAPEQAGGKTDHRADLFSLGVVLYRMTTGEQPFKGADTISILMATATQAARPPMEINRALPQALSDLILRLLAKWPEERPASAQAVVEALRAIEAQPAAAPRRKSRIAVPDRTVVEPAPKPATATRRGRVKLWIAYIWAAVILALLGGGIPFLLTHPLPGWSPAPDTSSVAEIKVDPVPTPPSIPGSRANNSWRPLFDGKGLTGWTVHQGKSDNWGVENGVLFTRGLDRGWLTTDRIFSDFELRLEYRTMAKANSGVAIRAPLEGDLTFTGLEIQILDDAGYKKLNPAETTGSIWGLVPATKPAPKPPGEWNLMHITARGREVTVELNGSKVLEADLKKYENQEAIFRGVKRSRGHIGLQSHTNRVDFRDIAVRSLSEDNEYGN